MWLAIDAQLSGTLPRRTIARGPLAPERLVIFAHAMAAVSLRCVLDAVRRHRLVLARRARGLCLNCGYAHSGVLGTCPECGVRTPAAPDAHDRHPDTGTPIGTSSTRNATRPQSAAVNLLRQPSAFRSYPPPGSAACHAA